MNHFQASINYLLFFNSILKNGEATSCFSKISHSIETNLSNALLKAGEKVSAHRTLNEAIKCNYDKWELWENFITIATDVGDFNGAVRKCSQ